MNYHIKPTSEQGYSLADSVRTFFRKEFPSSPIVKYSLMMSIILGEDVVLNEKMEWVFPSYESYVKLLAII